MALIEILNGPEAGSTVEFGPGKHLIGRAAGADLRIPAETVSGRHLEVEVAGETVRFRDLGSTNGTWSGGMKVAEGVWFPAAELRLGNVRLRLVDPAAGEARAAGAGEDEGADDSRARRARAGDLPEGSGGGWKLILMGITVAAAGGAAWYFSRGVEAGPGLEAGAVPGVRARAAGSGDLLDEAGHFAAERAEAWSLDPGLTLGEGALASAGGARRAVLTARHPVGQGSLHLQAVVEGALRAWPLAAWGRAGEDRPAGIWLGRAFGSDPVRLSLPEAADWFRLTLLLEGSGRLRSLEANEAAGRAGAGRHEGRRYLADGGNLLLVGETGQPLLGLHASRGDWQAVSGGFDLTGTGAGFLRVVAGADLQASGRGLVLADGGPVLVATGVEVLGSPGLLLGEGRLRHLVDLGGSRQVRVGAEDVRVEIEAAVALRWNLEGALAEAKLLSRAIERAAREEHPAELLSASARLLRDLPLDEGDVERALELRRGVILAGRRRFESLETAAGEALFFESPADIERVETAARHLAEELPATEVARQAGQLAGMLAESRARLLDRNAADHDAYRSRLLGALTRAYPYLAGWIRSRGQP